MRRILLISILMLSFQFALAKKVDSPNDVKSHVASIVSKIKNAKDQNKKIKYLKELREYIKDKTDDKFKKTEILFNNSFELQNLQAEKESVSRAKEIVKLNKQFVHEKEIYELLVAFDSVFKSTFLYFLDNKKQSFPTCSSLNDEIEGVYLNSAPEGTLLPYHAKVAIEVVDNLCSTLSKE